MRVCVSERVREREREGERRREGRRKRERRGGKGMRGKVRSVGRKGEGRKQCVSTNGVICIPSRLSALMLKSTADQLFGADIPSSSVS